MRARHRVIMGIALGLILLLLTPLTPVDAALLGEPTPLAALLDGDGQAMPSGAWRHDRDEQVHLDHALAFPSVGKILSPVAMGSGTLVHPQWVLTAAHVVDDDFDDADYSFYIGGDVYQAVRREIYEKWWDTQLGDGYDMALMQLNSPVTNIAPAVLNDDPDELGFVGTNVGFGVGGTGDQGYTTPAGTKRAGDNMVDVFGDWTSWSDRLILQDFDAPSGFTFEGDGPTVTDWFGDDEPLATEYIIGFGDSGGGLFIDFGDGPVLAGVHSFIAHQDEDYYGMYGTVAGSVRVSQFHDWAVSVIPEPTPSALILLAAAAATLIRFRRRQQPA